MYNIYNVLIYINVYNFNKKLYMIYIFIYNTLIKILKIFQI